MLQLKVLAGLRVCQVNLWALSAPAFRCAKGKVFIHGGTKVGFKAVYVSAFVYDAVSNPE
jgi:hypothetical protein